MPAFSLREACPALKRISWNVDTRIMVDLETPGPPLDDEHEGTTIIDQYAQELFNSPALERFAIRRVRGNLVRDSLARKHGKVRETVFRRAEDGTVKGPVNESVGMGMWDILYNGLVSLAIGTGCLKRC